jgi:Coenzyme PQQ synthesis protein D (PqqD)
MPDQVSCDLSGEAVILNLNSGMYYGIDEIGALIWAALEEPRTLEYLRETILRDYQIDKETCDRDVIAFLADMNAAGLIEINDAAIA